MRLDKLALIAMAGTLVLAGSVSAGHPRDKYRGNDQVNRYQDTAKVTRVEPIYKTVRINRPQRECWDEERTVERGYGGGDKTAGGIVGGILGGVAGHQVGKGRGKTAATIVGTLLGNKIGRDLSDDGPRRVETYVETDRVCRNVNDYREEERLQGYNVTYRYHGRSYDAFMKNRPGKRVHVKVKVVIDEY